MKLFIAFGITCITRCLCAERLVDKDDSQRASHPIKLLVLIIASDDQPIYLEHQKIWRSYMHLFPQQVECYFLKANPFLPMPYQINGDVIWISTTETIMPGILDKTMVSLEALLPRIEAEFDFVLRANLSSFFVFPNLLRFLEKCPLEQFYGSGGTTHAYGYGWNRWAHGCGFFMSKDVVRSLIEHKEYAYIQKENYHDDVVIANVLTYISHIPIVPTQRTDLLCVADWYREQECLSNNAYHFRIKNSDPEERNSQDLFVYQQLFKRFYPQIRWPCD